MSVLNADGQIRFLIQWFHEWSDLQRSDFVPILAEKYANKAYVNGIVNGISHVNCRDKPMSLFECRVKLFLEWFPKWTAEQRESFFNQITEIDTSFTEKLNHELQNGVATHNGDGADRDEAVLED